MLLYSFLVYINHMGFISYITMGVNEIFVNNDNVFKRYGYVYAGL